MRGMTMLVHNALFGREEKSLYGDMGIVHSETRTTDEEKSNT